MKPIRIHHNGRIIYRLPDGQLHREDGPAIIYSETMVSWYLNNYKFYSVDAYLDANDHISDEDKTLLKLEWG